MNAPLRTIPLLPALLLACCAACPPDGGDRLPLAAAASAPPAGAGAGADGLPVVLAVVNGQALPFVLDTGSNLTLVRPGTAAALKLPADPSRATAITGVGGTTRLPNAVLRDFQLGGRTWRDLSLPVAPGGEDPGRIAGIVGADLLRDAALELDLPAGRAVLRAERACRASPPPWRPREVRESVPVEVTPAGLVVLPLLLNGRPARALLDTGAVRTVLREDRLDALGIPAEALRAPAAGTVFGTGAGTAAFRIHEGATIGIGRETRETLPVVLAPLPESLGVDMVLGADVLGRHRLWLSYAARRLYLAAPAARP